MNEERRKKIGNMKLQAMGRRRRRRLVHLGSDLEGAITDAGYDPLLSL